MVLDPAFDRLRSCHREGVHLRGTKYDDLESRAVQPIDIIALTADSQSPGTMKESVQSAAMRINSRAAAEMDDPPMTRSLERRLDFINCYTILLLPLIAHKDRPG